MSDRGYYIENWSNESLVWDGSTALDITNTITLYANWKPRVFSIVYNGNGGTGTMISQTGLTIEQNNYFQKNIFIRKGYTFKEWNTQPDESGSSYLENGSVGYIDSNDNIVNLYAIWEANKYTIN